MAATRTATTHWEGSLVDGRGTIALDSSRQGPFEVTWASRTEDPQGLTSPEELIGAAHSACFSMVLTKTLSEAGHVPEALDTSADVTFQPGQGITRIMLRIRGTVSGVSEEEFLAAAENAKVNCPVSRALTGVMIELEAELS